MGWFFRSGQLFTTNANDISSMHGSIWTPEMGSRFGQLFGQLWSRSIGYRRSMSVIRSETQSGYCLYFSVIYSHTQPPSDKKIGELVFDGSPFFRKGGLGTNFHPDFRLFFLFMGALSFLPTNNNERQNFRKNHVAIISPQPDLTLI